MRPNPSPSVVPLPPPEREPDPADLIDWALLRDHLAFVLRAPRRRPWLTALAFLLVAGLGVSTLWLLPRSYRVQARILAQRNPVMATLSNPWLPRPYEGDAPTRAARETVLRRDNLVSLMHQTDLLGRWRRTRAPVVKLRDALVELVLRRERTDEERVDAMVERLEKRIGVEVTEGTVTITLDWPDAESAYLIVESAMQNFLEERHTTEISIVGDAITVLQVHAANLQRKIDGALEEIAALDRAAPRPRAPAAAPRSAAAPAAVRPPQDPEFLQLQGLLVAKKRAISDLEEFRRRRLKDAQDQLAQLRTVYADRHPSVLTAQQNMDALNGPSPQIEALQAEIVQLEQAVRERGGVAGEPSREPTARELAGRAAEASTPRGEREPPRLEFERGQLRQDLGKYSTLLDRIDSARVEMDTAQAAFKYRYSVITPPQLPKRPVKPNAILVVLASLVGGLAVAVFAAVTADVRSGLVLEKWQVERGLDLPVLHELRR